MSDKNISDQYDFTEIEPLTPFEESLRKKFLSAQNADFIDAQFLVGFYYHPASEMKVRIMSDERDFEKAVFKRFSCDPEQTLLFALELQSDDKFEKQWRSNQLNFDSTHGAAIIDDEVQLLITGIRILTPKAHEIVRRQDHHTAPTLKSIH
tara:strand:- start:83 stop:535 length:453 start_codon:yes stop_codon:yes gene_type:complete